MPSAGTEAAARVPAAEAAAEHMSIQMKWYSHGMLDDDRSVKPVLTKPAHLSEKTASTDCTPATNSHALGHFLLKPGRWYNLKLELGAPLRS